MTDLYMEIRHRVKLGMTTLSDVKFLLSEIDRLTAWNAQLLRETSTIDDLEAALAAALSRENALLRLGADAATKESSK